MAPIPRHKRNPKKYKKTPQPPIMTLTTLIETAHAKLKLGDVDDALAAAQQALLLAANDPHATLLCVNLLGQIAIEAGNPVAATVYFQQAVQLDPEGSLPEETGGGPEKFMWLAQLSEEGGADSVAWYEKAAGSLRNAIQGLSDKSERSDEEEVALMERQKMLAGVLCAVAEVYMTDLSWEEDAEGRCEASVTEATVTCPGSPEVWQTLANMRISQGRGGEAVAALKRSMESWMELPSNNPGIPEFAVRVSLARLLLEVAMMEEAQFVLDRLVKDDDQSVEAWYLGGWHRYLVGEMAKEEGKVEERTVVWKQARRRLMTCLRLYEMLEYEDERLGQHAKELLEEINKELGEPTTDDEETDAVVSDAEEEEEGDEDDEMQQ